MKSRLDFLTWTAADILIIEAITVPDCLYKIILPQQGGVLGEPEQAGWEDTE